MTDKKDNFCDQDDEINLGDRIAEAMDKSNYTVSQLVKKTGIPDSTLRGYLSKKSEPAGWVQIRSIIKETGVSASWFFGDPSEEDAKLQFNSIEKDLELLNSLFRYMTPIERGRILRRVLASVSRQLDHIADNDEDSAAK